MYKVAAIYTAKGNLYDLISGVLNAEMDDIETVDIVDGQLLNQVIADQGVSKATVRRFLRHCDAAVDAGADMILSTCSSVGDAADVASLVYDIPVVKIDDAMVHEAVENYTKIAVLASQPMTIPATVSFIKKVATAQGKEVEVVPAVADGAFAAAMSGDGQKHNDLVVEKAKSLKDVDVFVLAQASMMRVQDRLIQETGKPVIASPELCAKQIKAKRASGEL